MQANSRSAPQASLPRPHTFGLACAAASRARDCGCSRAALGMQAASLALAAAAAGSPPAPAADRRARNLASVLLARGAGALTPVLAASPCVAAVPAAELNVCGLLLLVLADEHVSQLSRHGHAISVCKQVSATHAHLCSPRARLSHRTHPSSHQPPP